MHRILLAVCALVLSFSAIDANSQGRLRATRSVTASVGAPWPMPASFKVSADFQKIFAMKFRFRATGYSCDILEAAFDRYFHYIFGGPSTHDLDNHYSVKFEADWNREAGLSQLDVKLLKACEKWPSLEMDESYTLSVKSGSAVLTSSGVWGALRGLETFSQIIYHCRMSGAWLINSTEISDKPRFPWRGVLLDTSRHYLHKRTVMQNLEAMSFNKMNVFHWHIVDDQSFPYQSRDFPDLSDKGAYDPVYNHLYTQEDIKEILEFARLRGIRVVPEFDTPGHSQSWGRGQPGLLTPCYSGQKFNGQYGPVNPILDSTYTFLKGFVKELTEVFPDKYLHLGGDEVDFGCWKSNPNITEFMKAQGFGSDYRKLESYYTEKLLAICSSYNSGYVVWQEIFDNGDKVRPDTVIHVWKSGVDHMAAVTAKGLRAIYSSSWYLDYISYGADWGNYYKVEPLAFNASDAQKALVMGGEACLWAEYVDASNVQSRLWPRASAVAERLWSPAKVRDMTSASTRIEEHRCRMVSRGIYASPPNGPGHCAHEIRPTVGPHKTEL